MSRRIYQETVRTPTFSVVSNRPLSYQTKFDKYVKNCISGRKSTDLVAIVIDAKYQNYLFTSSGFGWKTNKTITAY